MISSIVAPSLSAALMWRRVPGAYMCVKDASQAMLRSSTSLGGSAPLLYMGIAVAKELIGPHRIKLEKGIPCRIPLSTNIR